MTNLRMPLSIESGMEAEFNPPTDTEHRTRFIFLFEHASVMHERSCFFIWQGYRVETASEQLRKEGIKSKTRTDPKKILAGCTSVDSFWKLSAYSSNDIKKYPYKDLPII